MKIKIKFIVEVFILMYFKKVYIKKFIMYVCFIYDNYLSWGDKFNIVFMYDEYRSICFLYIRLVFKIK